MLYVIKCLLSFVGLGIIPYYVGKATAYWLTGLPENDKVICVALGYMTLIVIGIIVLILFTVYSTYCTFAN